MSSGGANHSRPSEASRSTSNSTTMRPNQSPPSYAIAPTPLSPTMRSVAHNAAAAPSSAASNLKITAMPKYHPAVYRSPNTSNTTTPGSSRPVSRGLLSPRSHARQISDIQRQHQEYQRQMMATLRQSTGIAHMSQADTPRAPHLAPHDSPGPTTPLTLEEPGDYLTARSIGEGSPREMTERLIREEQERRGGMRADRNSPAISPRC